MKRCKHKRELRSTGEDAYFAASNSKQGFYSYYGACFDQPAIKHLYAIKGGPGTGKSRLMREVADAARARGWRVEMIYCSSDPDSLDGVILWSNGEEGIALLDATAPHVYEPSRVGFRENLINLGDFWNVAQLVKDSDRIEALNAEKKDAYRRAYRYLSAYGEVAANRDEWVAPCQREKQIREYAARLMQGIPEGSGFSPKPALMSAVGMKGRVAFDTYLRQARRILWIEDCHGTAYRLTEALYATAAVRKLSVRVSKDPILPDRVDGLFLCGTGVAFAVGSAGECPYPCKRISTRRFLDSSRMRGVRTSVRYAERMQESLLGGALDELERVRRVHFALEEIYIEAMDFEKKEAFTKALCDEIFSLQIEQGCGKIEERE